MITLRYIAMVMLITLAQTAAYAEQACEPPSLGYYQRGSERLINALEYSDRLANEPEADIKRRKYIYQAMANDPKYLRKANIDLTRHLYDGKYEEPLVVVLRNLIDFPNMVTAAKKLFTDNTCRQSQRLLSSTN